MEKIRRPEERFFKEWSKRDPLLNTLAKNSGGYARKLFNYSSDLSDVTLLKMVKICTEHMEE